MSETTLTARIIAEDEATDVFNQVSQAAKQMSTEVSSAGSAMGGAATDIQKVGSAAKSAATDSKSFGTSMASLGFGIASTASSVVGLVRSFENISRAQDKATAANTKLESANVRVEKAQNALNQAIAKFGPESQQAAQAAAKVELELRKQGDAAARAANAAENVGFAWSNAAIDGVQFAAGIGTIVSSLGSFKGAAGTIVGAVGGLVGAFRNGGDSAGGLATAISSLGPAFGGFTTQATGIKGALAGLVTAFSGGASGAAGLVAALAPLALAVAAAVSAFKLFEGAGSFLDAFAAKAEGNFGRVQESYDKLIASFGQAVMIGPGPDAYIALLEKLGVSMDNTRGENEKLLRSIPGVGNVLADIAIQADKGIQSLFGTGEAAKAAGEGAEAAVEDFATLGDALDSFISESKAASTEAPKLFDEIVAGANKAGIAIEKISGADIKDIFGSMAEGAGPAAQSIDLVAAAFDAYSKAASDGKTATDPMAAAQNALAGGFDKVSQSANRMGQSMRPAQETTAQFYSTLNQIRQGAAIDPFTGMVGSVKSLGGQFGSAAVTGKEAEKVLRDLKGFGPVNVPIDANKSGFDTATAQVNTDVAEFERLNPTLTIGADGSAVVRETQTATTAVEAVPDDHVTALNADTGQFAFPVEQSKQQLANFPTEKKTNLAADASIFSTVVSGAGGTLEANIPDTKKTGLQAIADAFTGIVTGAGSLLETNVPDLKGVKLGADKSLFSTVVTGAGSELDAKIPLNRGTVLTALAGAFTGVVNAAGATLGLKIPERKDTALGANDSVFSSVVQGAGQSLQIKIPERKSTALDANKSLFEQGINAAASALGIKIPNSKETQLKAKDDSTSTINIVKSSLDTLHDKTITITVNAKAGVGASGYGKASLGLRHGGTTIANGPMNIRVGEGFHPELVSVMPLSGFSYHAAGGGTFASSLGDNIFNVAKPQIDRIIAAETARLRAEGETSYSEKAAAAERQREKESREAAGASSFRRGGTDVVTKPTNLQVGEGFKPEIVSVTPLTGSHAPPALRMDTTAITQGQKLKEEASKKERKREIENMAFRRTTSAVAPLHAQGGGTFAFGLDKLFAGTAPKGGTATATAAVSMQLENEDTFKQDTEELGKVFGDTIPKEWETKVAVDADDADATRAVSNVKRALDTLPSSKNIKITITSPAGASGSISFRHGGTSIIDHPTNIHVGEGFHPELVSVVPLGRVPHAQQGGQFLVKGTQSESETKQSTTSTEPTERGETQQIRDAEQAANRANGQLMDWMTGPIQTVKESQKGRSNELDDVFVGIDALYADYYRLTAAQHKYINNAATAPTNHIILANIAQQMLPVLDNIIGSFGEITEAFDEAATGALEDMDQMGQEVGRLNAAGQSANLLQGDLGTEGSSYNNQANQQSGDISEWKEIQDWWINYNQILQENLADVARWEGSAEYKAIYGAKGFGPAIVRKPTMFLTGEAGPEMVEVTPLAKGTRGGGGGNTGGSLARVEALLEKLVRKGGGMEANLVVDGQRMASVSEKYVGVKSYGDR